MKAHQKEDLRTRRDFLRQSACASLGVTGLVNALAQMRLMTAAMAQDIPDTGYKALVCLFLNGGHDSNNLLVPIGEAIPGSLRADYEAGRGVLKLDRTSLHPLQLPESTKAFSRHHQNLVQPMGVHAEAAAIADLFNAGKLAFISNVGTLAYPVPSRAAYNNSQVPLPLQLYSHSDQQSQWQSSVSDKPFSSGWGGRAAELLNASHNSGTSKVSMSISLAGLNSFQVGTSGQITQYVVQSSGTVPFSGFDSVTNDNNPYDGALNSDGSYRITDAGKRLQAFENIMRLTHSNLHEEEYSRIVMRARATEGLVGAAITSAATSGVDFNAIFNAAGATTSLGEQLKMVAKLIAGRTALGNTRQIFFCQVGGYDTHQTLLSSHANLVKELSNSLKAFHDSLQALNVWNDVVTFTASDFNRTFTPNNSDIAKAGSDHAWGGHAMVMGGDVRGGDLYGQFPSMKLGAAEGSIDAGTSLRGRWIPDISVDQYSSVLTRWMGAGSSEIDAMFPNLNRFDNALTSSANLDFL